MQACTQPPSTATSNTRLWMSETSDVPEWPLSTGHVMMFLSKLLLENVLSTQLTLLTTNKCIRRHQWKGLRWKPWVCAPALQNVFQINALPLPCVRLQGQAVVLAMSGSLCNLQQRIFESLGSYIPGFAVPCLSVCSVCFMSLLIVRFQSILAVYCRRCWYAPQSMSLILTLDFSAHKGEKKRQGDTVETCHPKHDCSFLIMVMLCSWFRQNLKMKKKNWGTADQHRVMRFMRCLVLSPSRWGHIGPHIVPLYKIIAVRSESVYF